MWNPDDLIVAPATVGRGAARAIVRISGAGLAGLLERLFRVSGRGLADSAAGGRLLEAVLAPDPLLLEWGAVPVGIIYWPGPTGPTGGPLAEVQFWSSRTVDLSGIHEQLEREGVKRIVAVLELAKSSCVEGR